MANKYTPPRPPLTEEELVIRENHPRVLLARLYALCFPNAPPTLDVALPEIMHLHPPTMMVLARFQSSAHNEVDLLLLSQLRYFLQLLDDRHHYLVQHYGQRRAAAACEQAAVARCAAIVAAVDALPFDTTPNDELVAAGFSDAILAEFDELLQEVNRHDADTTTYNTYLTEYANLYAQIERLCRDLETKDFAFFSVFSICAREGVVALPLFATPTDHVDKATKAAEAARHIRGMAEELDKPHFDKFLAKRPACSHLFFTRTFAAPTVTVPADAPCRVCELYQQ